MSGPDLDPRWVEVGEGAGRPRARSCRGAGPPAELGHADPLAVFTDLLGRRQGDPGQAFHLAVEDTTRLEITVDIRVSGLAGFLEGTRADQKEFGPRPVLLGIHFMGR